MPTKSREREEKALEELKVKAGEAQRAYEDARGELTDLTKQRDELSPENKHRRAHVRALEGSLGDSAALNGGQVTYMHSY